MCVASAACSGSKPSATVGDSRAPQASSASSEPKTVAASLEWGSAMLDIVEKNAYYADRVDFAAARNEVAQAASKSLADVRQVGVNVLLKLGDHHSQLLSKNEYKSLTAQVDEPVSSTRTSATEFADGVGLLEILHTKAVMPSDQATTYFSPARIGLATIKACGWIVDLRDDPGGSVAPMLEAVAPLLGPGTFVSYKDRAGHVDTFTISDDLHVIQPGGPNPHPTSTPAVDQSNLAQAPVAVLTNGGTASAAEGVTMAFLGRPRTRSFGQPTAGVPTGNDTYPLSDGSALVLTVAIGVDRTGTTHEGPIAPDDITPKQTGSADPTKDTAKRWLLEQSTCVDTSSPTDSEAG